MIPVCEDLGDPAWVLEPLMGRLEVCKRAREVWVTMVDEGYYRRVAGVFNELLGEMFKKN